MSSIRRVQLFGLLVVICVVGAVIAILAAAGSGGVVATSKGGQGALAAAQRAGRPRLIFRNLDRGEPQTYGQLALARLGTGARRTLLPLKCDRVSFVADTGLCVTRSTAFAAGYRAEIFGPDLRRRGEVPVDGVPSRARVSADGRYGSVTMFVAGHSYADLGGFSTTTTLIDLRRGKRIARLEDFTAIRDGKRITAPDANYWGVTFARDSDRFYATLSTGGHIYLVRGSIARRTMVTIHDDVECPSLSPDGTKIVFKKRVGAGGKRWRLYVLDLASNRETPLAETRSIDDQAEWLDDQHVLYGVGEEIWMEPVDGTGPPVRYADHGDSPAVVR